MKDFNQLIYQVKNNAKIHLPGLPSFLHPVWMKIAQEHFLCCILDMHVVKQACTINASYKIHLDRSVQMVFIPKKVVCRLDISHIAQYKARLRLAFIQN